MELGVIVVLISLAIVAAFNLLGGGISTSFDKTSTALNSAS